MHRGSKNVNDLKFVRFFYFINSIINKLQIK